MNKSTGFSLVELLVVLLLLGIIATIVGTNVLSRAEGGKVRASKVEVQRLASAVDEFYLDTGRAPRELRELVQKPGNATGWNGPYVNEANLNDPWDNPYSYRYPGQCRDFDISTRAQGDGEEISNCN